MISTNYSTEITIQKAGKYLKVWERKTRVHLLARLHTWYKRRNFSHKFNEICLAIFDQSSHVIYLTWYRFLLLFWEFTSIIPFMAWFQDSNKVKGKSYNFMSSISCKYSAKIILFNLKLIVQSFNFMIWMEEFWI